MRRPAAPGSARERDGRTRRAGAGRADAGQDSTKDAADGGSRGTGPAANQRGGDQRGEKRRGEDGAEGRADGRRADRLPAQPGRADREKTRQVSTADTGTGTAGSRDPGRAGSPRDRASDKTEGRAAGPGTGRGATGSTTGRGAAGVAKDRGAAGVAKDRGAAGRRAGTARTDGRGRRIGAGGIAAIPGSSGGSPTRGRGSTDDPASGPGPGTGSTSGPGGTDGTDGTDGTGDENGTDTTGEGTAASTARPSRTPADARPARPRPVRPAPHIVRRRRVALLVVVLVLLGGLAGGVAFLLYGSGLADVETVTVDGALAVPSDQVLAAAAIPTGGPLVAVDTSGAEQRVAALPGVASVTVGRDWPHTVVVTVVERVAVALADTPKGLMLVDRTGVPYEQAPEVPPMLPHLDVGIAGTIAPGDVQTTAGLGVLAALPDAVRSQVVTITVIAPAATGGLPTVELALSDDRRVVWGSAENLQRKAAVLAALLTEKGSVFDVASPDLPTIRR